MDMICEECGNELGECSCVENVMGIYHAEKNGEGSYCGSKGPTTDDAQKVNCERCLKLLEEEREKKCFHCNSTTKLELIAEDEDGTSQVWAKKCPKCGYIDAWANNDKFRDQEKT